MRVALTGAATGIGAEVAAKMKARGDHVTAFDIQEPAANVDAWIKTDLSDPASISSALAQARGPFDTLINNAGLPPREGLAERVLQVNFFGLRSFMLGMLGKLSEGASIVNTASRAGSMWRDNLDQVKALMALEQADLPDFLEQQHIDATRAYNLSKEALIVLTKAQTQDMITRGFRMNSVSPAAVDTDILADFTAAFGDRVAQNIARVGRPGNVGEIADVIVFLASPESGWIKGQDLVIDGGMSALATRDALGF